MNDELPVAYLGCHVDDLLIAASGKKHLPHTWEVGEFEFLGSKITVGETVRLSMPRRGSSP